METCRITKIILDGFKGLEREYDLGPATVLTGANGTGKSAALEGLIYAISGAVHGGRSLDHIASFFPPRGGYVQIEDASGHWLKRGVSRDLEKVKVSEVLETSDAKEGEEPNLKPWEAAGAVLDLKEFLGLSPNLRREFVLRMCGSGEQNSSKLLSEIELEYAREICGAIATPVILDAHQLNGEKVSPLWPAWRRRLGLREILASHLVQGKTLTELCLKLSAVAKDSKNASRKAATEAKAAIRELEAEAQGARAAAADIKARRAATEKIRADLTEARVRTDRLKEACLFHAQAETASEEVKRRLYAANTALENAPSPGEAPAAPGGDPRREGALKAISEAQKYEAETAAELQRFALDDKRLSELNEELQSLTGQARAHKRLAIGLAMELLEKIPDSADPSMPALRAALVELGAQWKSTMGDLRTRGLETRSAIAEESKKYANWEESYQVRKAAAEHAVVLTQKARVVLMKLDEASSGDSSTYFARLKEWESRKEAHLAATSALGRATSQLEETARRVKAAEDRLASARKDGVPAGIAELEVTLRGAIALEEEAERAAGAAEAYRKAVESAESHTVDEQAWKAAERAVATVREKLVGAATAPLLSVLNQVLEQASRPERAYLELENDRGKPIFELGWVRGPERIALPALSAGEAAIFGGALSIAIAMKSPGRRVLLAEADPLDRENLLAFLQAVAPWAPKLDACVVATASSVPHIALVAGWAIVRLGEEARVP